MALPKRPFLPSLGGYRTPEVRDLAARLSAWGTGVNGVLDALPPALAALERRMTELEASAGDGTIADHATTHENGGTDEISVLGLSGLLADGQTPLAHKTSHQSGGSDAIKLDDLAAPDDNTDLNASTSAHGLLRKLSGVTTQLLDGGGNWNTSINSRIAALEGVAPIITQWSADAPPTGTPHTKSDEFDSGSAWDAKWGEFDQNAELTPSVANGFGVMTLATQGAATRHVAMYQTVPAVADYAFACRCGFAQPGALAGTVQMGLFISENLASAPTTADWRTIRMAQGATLTVSEGTFSGFDQNVGNLVSFNHVAHENYYRFRVTGTTNAGIDWSKDGVNWHELFSGAIGFTPVHMGIYMRNQSTGGTAYGRVQWFRVIQATVALGDLSPGGRVLNVYA